MRHAVWIVSAVLCGIAASADEFPQNTNEIKSLTVDQAKALAQRKWALSLDGLTTVSDSSRRSASLTSSPAIGRPFAIRHLLAGNTGSCEECRHARQRVQEQSANVWLRTRAPRGKALHGLFPLDRPQETPRVSRVDRHRILPGQAGPQPARSIPDAV